MVVSGLMAEGVVDTKVVQMAIQEAVAVVEGSTIGEIAGSGSGGGGGGGGTSSRIGPNGLSVQLLKRTAFLLRLLHLLVKLEDTGIINPGNMFSR